MATRVPSPPGSGIAAFHGCNRPTTLFTGADAGERLTLKAAGRAIGKED